MRTMINVCAVCKECQGQMVSEGCGPYLPRIYTYRCSNCGRRAITQHKIHAAPHFTPPRVATKKDFESRRIWTPD